MRFLLHMALASMLAVLFGCSNQRPSSEAQSGDGLEARRQHIREQERKVSDEAQARKERSIAILEAEKVPYIEHLPLIETEAESTRRTTEGVAVRALALVVVALKGEGLELEAVKDLIDEYRLASAFTPMERKFINNPAPSEHDRAQFAWRYECYWVMLWALGYVDSLERPDKVCDVEKAVSILRGHDREGFFEKAHLRSQAEILDAADLIYRYHWALVDARINNREAPAGLDEEIVMERHRALNWLIGYMDQEWDDVSTDT